MEVSKWIARPDGKTQFLKIETIFEKRERIFMLKISSHISYCSLVRIIEHKSPQVGTERTFGARFEIEMEKSFRLLAHHQVKLVHT